MAYVLNQDDEDQKPTAVGPGLTLTPLGGTAGVAQPQAGEPNGNQASGPQFVGMGQYLDANRSVAQGIGNKLADHAEAMGQDALGAVDNASKNFGRESDAAKSTPYSGQSVGVGDGPTIEEARANSNQSYAGPASLNSTALGAGTRSFVQSAADEAKNLGSTAGVQAALGHGPGSAYDAALVGAASGARLGNVAQTYGTGRLQAALDQANTAAGKTHDANVQVAKTDSAGWNGAVQGYGKDMDARNAPAAAEPEQTPSLTWDQFNGKGRGILGSDFGLDNNTNAKYQFSRSTFDQMTPEEKAELSRIEAGGVPGNGDREAWKMFADHIKEKYGQH